MNRITIKDLNQACRVLNKTLNRPMEYCQPGQPFKANIGNFHIDQAYGGFQLAEVSSDGGGIRSYGGHVPAREVYERIHAMVDGARIVQDATGKPKE